MMVIKSPISNSVCLLIILFLNHISFGQNTEYENFISNGNNQAEINFIKAEKEYRKAISLISDSVKAKYNLSNSLYKNELYEEALLNQISASKDITNSVEKHKIFHNIGNIFMKQNLCKEAVEAYKNALRNNSSDDETRYNLAIAKECAEQQENQKESEGEDENDDNKDKDKQENENEKDDKDKPGNDKENDKDQNNNNKDSQTPDNPNTNNNKTQKGSKLSKQQIKNLLEAMNREENKVQEKINAKKLKGVKVKNEKDW